MVSEILEITATISASSSIICTLMSFKHINTVQRYQISKMDKMWQFLLNAMRLTQIYYTAISNNNSNNNNNNNNKTKLYS